MLIELEFTEEEIVTLEDILLSYFDTPVHTKIRAAIKAAKNQQIVDNPWEGFLPEDTE